MCYYLNFDCKFNSSKYGDPLLAIIQVQIYFRQKARTGAYNSTIQGVGSTMQTLNHSVFFQTSLGTQCPNLKTGYRYENQF